MHRLGGNQGLTCYLDLQISPAKDFQPVFAHPSQVSSKEDRQ